MQFSVLHLLLVITSMAVSAAAQDSPPDSSVQETRNKIEALVSQAREVTLASLNMTEPGCGRCTPDKLRIRKEWGALTAEERKNYTNAVLCLQSKSPNSPADLVPGAQSRFDDFVGTHINQTLTIHYTGNFLGWHRYYTWLYENALQDECSYTGTQPYWDWTKTAAEGLDNSPIFDGSDTSMSGDGVHVENMTEIVLGGTAGLPAIYLPPGNGGGCVMTGPFANMTVNLGPAALNAPGNVTVANPNGPLAYNPRCLKRSLTLEVNQAYANATSVINLLTSTSDVYAFEMQMQSVPGSGDIGVHGGGHYTFGGDPADDVFVSPGDPLFYLHHSMIDRMWWTWQQIDPAERVSGPKAVIGTNTFLNQPPSANTTLEDYVEYGFAAGPPKQLKELMSIVDGPFCYIYE